jgi:hypothetical protein
MIKPERYVRNGKDTTKYAMNKRLANKLLPFGKMV